jgi:hypothetical protein
MSVFLAGTRSTEEFAKVKAGLGGGGSLPSEYLWYFLFGLAFIILVSVVVSAIRRRRLGTPFRGWISISDPARIAAVFKRAADRQASCTLEIFDHHHSSVYRGHVFEARPDSHLLLELSRLPVLEADFDGFPAQVHLNFRPAPKEEMEHYQFSSHTQAINYQREKTWRVARVAIAWPKCVISAQRRDFLRLEPLGRHAMRAVIRRLPDDFKGLADELELIAEGEVLDLSVGGLQLLCDGAAEVMEHQKYLVILDLPMDDLDLELKSPRLYLLFQPLSRDIINRNNETRPVQTVIRGNFTGRYRRQPDTGLWYTTDFSPESFQDLAHWINAYQRFLLKKERGLMSTPEVRVNIYPSRPPERPASNKDDDQ